jgi:hypothetical protein
MGIAEAIVGGALVGGASSIIGGDRAADAQTDAANLSIGEQRRQYDTTRADFAPFRKSGVQALDRQNFLLGLGDPYAYSGIGTEPTREQFTQHIAAVPAQKGKHSWMQGGPLNLLPAGGGTSGSAARDVFDENAYNKAMEEYNASKAGLAPDGDYGSLMKNFTGQDLENEPGYQFQKTQGQNALNQGAIARGGYFTGNALKELSRYNTDYAGTKYNEAFNRDAANKSRQYGFLGGVINSGLGATQGTAAAGTNAANQITGQYGAIGNAQAANYVNTGNQIGNVANSVGTGMVVGNYLNDSGGTGNVWGTRPLPGYGPNSSTMPNVG